MTQSNSNERIFISVTKDQRLSVRWSSGGETLVAQSTRPLSSWDSLFRHSHERNELRRTRRLDGNPFMPASVFGIGRISSRYRGRFSSLGPFRDEPVSSVVENAAVCGCTKRCSGLCGVDSQSHRRVPVERKHTVIRSQRKSKAPAVKRVSAVPGVTSTSCRTVDSGKLSKATRSARRELRRIVNRLKLRAPATSRGGSSKGEVRFSLMDPLALDNSTYSASNSMMGSERWLTPRHQTESPLLPLVEVYWKGEVQPVLVFRDAIHPLDSVASIRDKIDAALRSLPGGSTLSGDSNWTFEAFHPLVQRLLEQIHLDFLTFYSDSEHSRYTGTEAKEMRLAVLRHREAAALLSPYLRHVRLTLESSTSVVSLFSKGSISAGILKRFGGLPTSRFYQTVVPLIVPPVPRSSVRELKSALKPVLECIAAQLDRLEAHLNSGARKPPPTNCDIPCYRPSAARVAMRLAANMRRQAAKRAYHQKLLEGGPSYTSDASGHVAIAIPRIVIMPNRPAPKWDLASIMVTQIAEICREGRSSDAPLTAELADEESIASDEEMLKILLGDAHSGVTSPSTSTRSRSPIDPSSPTRARGTSPIQRGAALSPAIEGGEKVPSGDLHSNMTAVEELRRTVEEGVAPLHQRDALGWSFLDYVVWRRKPALVRVLCEGGIPLHFGDSTNGDTALHRLIKAGRRKTVADVRCIHAMFACADPAAFASLLATRNFQNVTPFALAIQLQDLVMIQAIYAAAQSPRHRAATSATFPSREEQEQLESIFGFDSFLDLCSLPLLQWTESNTLAEVTSPIPGDVCGGTILHRALTAPPFAVVSATARDTVVAWAASRVDPMLKDRHNRTAFHIAAMIGDLRWLVPLLDFLQSRGGSSVLNMSRSAPQSARALSRVMTSLTTMPSTTVATKHAVQCADCLGNTPLHSALVYCRSRRALATEGVAYVSHPLVIPHIQAEAQNKVGDTVLHLVMKRRLFELLDPLCKNWKYEAAATLHRLLRLRNDDGDTILGCAIKSQFSEGVRFILSLEANAEVALTTPCSANRCPLLLAVAVAAARDAAGAKKSVMDERPHCAARETWDCLSILLRYADQYGVLRSLMHCLSGPESETALHAACRNQLWHVCALLIANGASPNTLDARGRSALACSFEHPTDVSLPRLLMANDRSDPSTGESLLCCIRARGAAAACPEFVKQFFLERSLLPWRSVSFASPIFLAALKTGNLMVVEELFALGARLEASEDLIPAEFLCDMFIAARDDESGERWKTRPRFWFFQRTLRAAQLRDRVEALVVRMCQEDWVTTARSSALLQKAIAAGFECVAGEILRTASPEHLRQCYASILSIRRGSPEEHLLVTTARQPELMHWSKVTRRQLIVGASRSLVAMASRGDDTPAVVRYEDCAHWLRIALGAWRHSSNLEALVLFFFGTCDRLTLDYFASCPTAGVHVSTSQPLPRATPVCLGTAETLACEWLLNRSLLSPQALLAVAVVERQRTVMRVVFGDDDLLHLLRIEHLLLTPVALDAAVIRYFRKECVMPWVSSCAAACVAHALPSPICVVLQCVEGDCDTLHHEALTVWNCFVALTPRPLVYRIVRECLLASVCVGVHGISGFLLAQVNTHPSLRDGWAEVIGMDWKCPASSSATASHGLGTSNLLTAHIASPRKTIYCFQKITPIILDLFKPVMSTAMGPCCVDAFFKAVPMSLTQLCNDRGSQLRRMWDVLLVFFMGGASSLFGRRPASRPRASFTSTDVILWNALEDEVVASFAFGLVAMTASDTGATFMQCLSIAHVSVMIREGLTLSLLHLVRNTDCFPQLSRILSLSTLPCGQRFLSLLTRSAPDVIPGGVVMEAVSVCRDEYSDWRTHCAPWIDHVLDVFHANGARRIPAATRQRCPVLSFMRDVARSDPATVRDAVSKTTPLHDAVLRDREDVVVHILQAQSRELDVNALDGEGRTPMMLAAKLGRIGVASQLVSTGVDLLLEDDSGYGCLHYAANSQIVELILADDDGPEAANSRSSKPHHASPLMHLLRSGKFSSAMAMLQSPNCDDCVLDTMIDQASGETLLHAACRSARSVPIELLELLLGRLPTAYIVRISDSGYSARDYVAPRSAADLLLLARGVERRIRLWPEGTFSIGVRDHRSLRGHLTPLLGVAADNNSAVQQLTRFHPRRDEASMDIDELAWEYASQRRDTDLLELLELGSLDMHKVRLYGIPAPRSETDKRSLARDINHLLHGRFGGARGGCQLVFPDDAAATGADHAAPYAAAHMIDDEKIPLLLSTPELSVKSRTLRAVREPPLGPRYRTHLLANTTSLLHLVCKNSCMKSLEFIMRNNSSQGSPNKLICDLLASSWDEQGHSPFHVAVIHRQWDVVVELLRARVPLVRAPSTLVTPLEYFSSPIHLRVLQWKFGSNVPGEPRPFCHVVGNCEAVGRERRFADADAQPVAHALLRLDPLTSSALQARIQRIVLTSILENSVPAAVRGALQTVHDMFVEEHQRRMIATRWCSPSNTLDLFQRIQTHILSGITVTLDLEGADSRDGSERERTKALFLFHVAGGALQRWLQFVLLDVLLSSTASMGWVGCLLLKQLRLTCAPTKKGHRGRTTHAIPEALLEQESPAGHFRLSSTFYVDDDNILQLADVRELVREYLCMPAVEVAEETASTMAMACKGSQVRLRLSVVDEDVLLASRLADALYSGRYVSDQLPIGSEYSTADVCWRRLRDRLSALVVAPVTEEQQPAAATDGDAIEKPAVPFQSIQRPLHRLTRYLAHIHDVVKRQLLQFVIYRKTPGNAARARTEIHLSGAAQPLPPGCRSVVVLCYSQDDSGFVLDLEGQRKAKVCAFAGLSALTRNWTGGATKATRKVCGSEKGAGPQGLSLLWKCRTHVENESEVIVCCPFLNVQPSAAYDGDVLSSSGRHDAVASLNTSHISVFRRSHWTDHKCSMHMWDDRGDTPQLILVDSKRRDDSAPATARPESVLLEFNATEAQKMKPLPIRLRTRWSAPSTLGECVARSSALSMAASEALRLLEAETRPVSAPKNARSSSDTRFSSVIRCVFEYVVDPRCLWGVLRRLNRACKAEVEEMAKTGTLLQSFAAHVQHRVEEVARLLQASGSAKRRLGVGCITPSLCGSYLQIRGARGVTLSADRIFEAFVANPILVFHHVCSTYGVTQGAALPPFAPGISGRRGQGQGCSGPHALHRNVIRTSFAVLHSTFAAMWAMHEFLEDFEVHCREVVAAAEESAANREQLGS